MKIKKVFMMFTSLILSVCLLAGCAPGFVNPGDNLGGGGTVSSAPQESSSEYSSEISAAVSSDAVASEATEVPEGATRITGEDLDGDGKYKISVEGNYYVIGELAGKINVRSGGVTLYLYNAALSYEKKVIDSTYDLTISLIGKNTVVNTNEEDGGSNAIDVEGELVINGGGSLSVVSTKNGVKGCSVSIVGAALDIEADKDGIHAEIDAYDGAAEEPSPAYTDGGYVYLNGAEVTVRSVDDGIQADTFVNVTGNSALNILAGGGAPSSVTTASSDNASGKGIKAGQIDWTDASGNEADIDWDGYLIWIESGNITVNSNDDALHSNGELLIEGGSLTLSSGDDAVHSDNLLQITGGSIAIDKCYEGVESAKVEISGGTIEIESYEDGINAADGTQNRVGVSNDNCHIIISGGYISVNCIGSEGDGVDSNGTILISGGELYIAGSGNSTDAALDADGGILINGGYVFAAGSLGMVETPASNSSQYCVSFARNTSISAGTTLYLCDSEGNCIMYFTAPRNCQSLILSCPQFENGKAYSIYGGDSELAAFTISSVITTVGSSSSISNPGGAPGGNQQGINIPGFGGRK